MTTKTIGQLQGEMRAKRREARELREKAMIADRYAAKLSNLLLRMKAQAK